MDGIRRRTVAGGEDLAASTNQVECSEEHSLSLSQCGSLEECHGEHYLARSRHASLRKEDRLSIARASIWREEAESSCVTSVNDVQGKHKLSQNNLSIDTRSQTKMADELATRCLEDLEKAVKRRKMMGLHNLDFPPLLCPESMFTRAIPLGIYSDAYCRSPSNRIGFYNSPATTILGEMDAPSKKVSQKAAAVEKYVFGGQVKPWRNPDVRPLDKKTYEAPVLSEAEKQFLIETNNFLGESPPKSGKKHIESKPVLGGSPMLTVLSQLQKGKVDQNNYMCPRETSNVQLNSERRKCSLTDSGTVLLESEGEETITEKDTSAYSQQEVSARYAIPENLEKAAENIVRYQYYVEAGIDEKLIAPIRERWMKNALHLINKEVKRGISDETIQQTLLHVLEEIRHDYILSMRKAILDYILQDDKECRRLGLVEIEHVLRVVESANFERHRATEVLTPEWHAAVFNAHGAVTGILHRLNSQSLEIAAVWQSTFANNFFLDSSSEDFCSKLPFELPAFVLREKGCAKSVRESLEKDWVPVCTRLLKQAVPVPPKSDLSGFYEAMSVLISNQIRKLVEDSIARFTKFIFSYRKMNTDNVSLENQLSASKSIPVLEEYKPLFGQERRLSEITCDAWMKIIPPFLVSLKYGNHVYSVDPSFEEIEAALLEVVDFAVSQGSGITIHDTDKPELYTITLSRMAADDEFLQVAKHHISQVVKSNSKAPMDLMKSFSIFEDLADMSPEEYASDFNKQEKSLSDYELALNNLTERANAVESASANNVDCGFVRVQCVEFKGSLINKANNVCLLLKRQVLMQMNNANLEVVGHCERIARDITKVPTNVEEAVTLRK